jgi:hypothetical protein
MERAAIACRHDGRVVACRECHEIWRMSKRKTPKAWTAYKLAKVGKRLGTVYGDSEAEALQAAFKEFDVKTEADRRRIYLRSQ